MVETVVTESLGLEDFQAGMARLEGGERKETLGPSWTQEWGGHLHQVHGGRTTCPDTEGTELVYTGTAAGTGYSKTGGTSDYFCLPAVPEYLNNQSGVQGHSSIEGAE